MEVVPNTPLALVPLERKIRLLSNFMSPCAGHAMDENGLVRILNAEGNRPPLIWCFNSLQELPALANALGSDQPVIGIRSLNAVVNFEKKFVQEDEEIAHYYAQIIQEHIELTTFWIGGNCQGAAVAAELANCLSLQGKHALGLFQMEWQSLIPWPGSCHFLFGEQSTKFNPFLKGEDPWPIWNLIYRTVTCGFLTGGHGSYFTPQNIASLVAGLQGQLQQEGPQTGITMGQHADLGPVWHPPISVRKDTTIHLQTSGSHRYTDTQIYAFWVPQSLGQFVKTETCRIEVDGQFLKLLVQAPSDVGTWTLRLFWCDTQDGPKQWQNDTCQTWNVQVG